MRIYIDEYGSFTPTSKPQSYSCVTALIIPDVIEAEFLQAFNQWKLSSFLQGKIDKNGEIKGKVLNEQEFSSLIWLLAKYDVLIECVCVDMGTISQSDFEDVKKKYADNFSKSQMGTKLSQELNCDPIMSLSNPNFAQGYTLFELTNNVLKVSIPYYVQRFPQTLGNWEWILDAKDITITDYEKILTQLVKPFLQSINLKNPIGVLESEDYSVMRNYFIAHEDLLEPLKSEIKEKPGVIFSISKIMENIVYEQSHTNLGLQIVDILANCIGRAMRGNLQFEGWRYIPGLIVLRADQAVQILRFSSNELPSTPLHTREFVNYLGQFGKYMLVPDEIRPKMTKGYMAWEFLNTLSVQGRKKGIVIDY